MLESEIRTQLKEMCSEREKDVQMIQQMVEGAHKKVVSDLAKKQSASKTEILSQVQQHLSKGLEDNRDWTEKALDDKVRVDEVQDALKKITDSFHGKLANL